MPKKPGRLALWRGRGVHGSCDGRKIINNFMYRNYYYTFCIGKYSFLVMESLRLKTLRVESALVDHVPACVYTRLRTASLRVWILFPGVSQSHHCCLRGYSVDQRVASTITTLKVKGTQLPASCKFCLLYVWTADRGGYIGWEYKYWTIWTRAMQC